MQVLTLKSGYCRTYLICPGTIYGTPKNQLVDAGLQNQHSIQIPLLIKGSLDRGQAGVVGKGLALWPDVHVDDGQFRFLLAILPIRISRLRFLVADQFIALYDTIVKNGPDNVDHGVKGYYFSENGEHSWHELSVAIGQAMVELGLSKSYEPTTFTVEELIKYFSSEVARLNSLRLTKILMCLVPGVW